MPTQTAGPNTGKRRLHEIPLNATIETTEKFPEESWWEISLNKTTEKTVAVVLKHCNVYIETDGFVLFFWVAVFNKGIGCWLSCDSAHMHIFNVKSVTSFAAMKIGEW